MYEAQGIGLAASQVDVHERVIVMDLSEDASEPRVFINPQITPLTDELFGYQEGCLSVPGFYEEVTRPARVKIEALNEQGEAFEMEAEDYWPSVFNMSATIWLANSSSIICRI